MEIHFKTKKLEKIANNQKLLVKEYGPQCAKKIRTKLDDMAAATCLEDLRYAPGHYHELKGDRKEQFACDLIHPFRLVFTPLEKPVPKKEDGQIIWEEIRGAIIIEIVDYH